MVAPKAGRVGVRRDAAAAAASARSCTASSSSSSLASLSSGARGLMLARTARRGRVGVACPPRASAADEGGRRRGGRRNHSPSRRDASFLGRVSFMLRALTELPRTPGFGEPDETDDGNPAPAADKRASTSRSEGGSGSEAAMPRGRQERGGRGGGERHGSDTRRMRRAAPERTTTTAGSGGEKMVYKNRGDTVEVEGGEAFTLGWPRTLHECYEMGPEIGRGSFGVVRVAKERWPVQFTAQSQTGHSALQQKFAVKSIPKRPKRRTRRKRYLQGTDEKANAEAMVRRQRQKLLGEVAFMVGLSDCPFSAQLVGAYEDETHAHLVVELCEGGDLKRLLRERGTLTEKESCEVMFTALNFIKHCHEKGFVFSDVKPANFMLKFKAPEASTRDDAGASASASVDECGVGDELDCEAVGSGSYGPLVVKGIDFGCSQRIGDPRGKNMLIKRTGTPAYWAPEVFMRYYDSKADVWSCGMMMYEMLVGTLPFWDDIEQCTPKEVQKGVMFGEVCFKEGTKGEHVSEEARDLVQRMLDKDPRTRITIEEALNHPWVKSNCC